MDAINNILLAALAEDATVSTVELAARVHLSVPAVNKRLLRLREDGVIRRYTVLTDAARVGKPLTAFILVVLQYAEGAAQALTEALQSDPDVLECYAITGEYDYLIKVSAADVEALENTLLRLKKQRGVLRSHTMLSLMEHKNAPTVLPKTEALT